MAICLDKDTLWCVTCRRKIERVFLVIWIELGFSGEFCDVGLSCIIYTRKSGLQVRDRIFENFWKSKYRPKFLIWFLGITHQRVSLEKLWTIRKNWSCPEILDGYRKSLLSNRTGHLFPQLKENVRSLWMIGSECMRTSITVGFKRLHGPCHFRFMFFGTRGQRAWACRFLDWSDFTMLPPTQTSASDQNNRTFHPGVPADLDPPRFGPPGPNPLADMDPRGSKSARGFGPPSQKASE